jgi:hypothetical protein
MPNGRSRALSDQMAPPDTSHAAQRLRQAVAQQGEARQAVDLVRSVGGSPTVAAKQRQVSADSAAYVAAMAYRKTHK